MNLMKSLFLLLLMVGCQVVQAETLESLLASGQLEARAVVKTPAPYFQKAPIEMVVEVGTPYRFSKVTRVRDFTVPATVVRRLNKSAFNETRRKDGESWNFQSLRFALHPEREGRLSTPSLTSFISIETEANGVVEGELKLSVPELDVDVPAGTEDLISWVAAETFDVEETWEGSLKSYQVGDAVTRVRRFTIRGAPAMAIPASAPIKLDGVDVYHAPALVDDKEVGGELQGEREERVVFTFKGGGSYAIPDQQAYWFNLKTKSVEKIDFPGRALEVVGASAEKTTAESEPEPRGKSRGMVYAGLTVLVGVFVYMLYWWIGRPSWLLHVRDKLEIMRQHRRARADFMHAAEQLDSRRCLEVLYQQMSEHAEWQLSVASAGDPELSAIADTLMAHAYGGGNPPKANEVQRLWVLCKPSKQKLKRPDALLLNPRASQGG